MPCARIWLLEGQQFACHALAAPSRGVFTDVGGVRTGSGNIRVQSRCPVLQACPPTTISSVVERLPERSRTVTDDAEQIPALLGPPPHDSIHHDRRCVDVDVDALEPALPARASPAGLVRVVRVIDRARARFGVLAHEHVERAVPRSEQGETRNASVERARPRAPTSSTGVARCTKRRCPPNRPHPDRAKDVAIPTTRFRRARYRCVRGSKDR